MDSLGPEKNIHMIGAINHITTTRPLTMFIAAQKGTTRGEPIYAIWDQSNVMGKSPRPDATPNCNQLEDVPIVTELRLQDWPRQRSSGQTR
jgi:hypothetical protein